MASPCVVGLNEGVDFLDEVLGADERSATDLAFGGEREPTLYLVEPGRVSRRVMDMETRSRGKPGADFGMLVGGIVVGHQVSVEVRRNIRLDVLKETQEFLVPVTSAAPGENLAVRDIEGGEQGRGAVPG